MRVDSGDEQRSARSPSSGNANHLDSGDNNDNDEDDDDGNISGVSGTYDDNDEVPFGPSRAVAGGEAKGPSKSLEILRRIGSHANQHDGGDLEQGITQSYLSHVMSQKPINGVHFSDNFLVKKECQD